MSRTVVVVARVVSAVALLLVAALYLLASMPFAYYQVLHSALFSWMPAFIRWHPLMQAVSVVLLALTCSRTRLGGRQWSRYVLVGGLTSAVGMAATVVWPVILTFEMSAVLFFAPVLVLAFVGVSDLVPTVAVDNRRRPGAPMLLAVAAVAGLLSAAIYFLHGQILWRGHAGGLQIDEVAVGFGASLLGHVAIFVAAALVIVVLRRASSSPWVPWAASSGELAGIAVVAAFLIKRVLLTSLTLEDGRSIAIAIALSIALTVYCAGLGARLRAMGHRESRTSPVPDAPRRAPRWPVVMAWATVGVVGLEVLPRALRLADWGTTLQEMVVSVTWIALVAVLLELWSPGFRRAVAALLLSVLALGVTATTLGARGGKGVSRPRSLDLGLAIERYATVDTSMRVVLDLLRPMVSDTQFFFDLEKVGDVTDSRTLRAVPLRTVDHPGSGSAYRPNIFVFVVDSLRPDYLSAYNPDVNFTPAIGAFARESIVMRHAFAPYTGTALSEPALWAGGLIPRRMYVQPFSMVNNLERLVSLGGYRQYISVDEILGEILGDVPGLVRLDSQLAHPERRDEMFKFDLCSTAEELKARLDHDAGSAAPVFFFSQAQSLHIRVLAGNEYPQYEGLHNGHSVFFKPAADALGRVDACFGQFVRYLKDRQLYDDSIVIVTSDHGDYYGENGRWGHAFYVGPETIRVPLIMHVPEKLLVDRRWDPNAVSMLTDVTPTLYELLGYGPVLSDEVLGRPLIVSSARAPVETPDTFLMQSSYSRIFGLLDGHGDWLYTASANQVREELFDLRDGQSVNQPLTPADRVLYRKTVLDRLARLNAHYRAD